MVVYFLCYGASMLLAAVYLYFYDYRRSGNPLHLRALFSAFWIGGQGISCLKLSHLQTDWELETWACFFVAYTAFWVMFELIDKKLSVRETWSGSKFLCESDDMGRGYELGLFTAVILLTLVSFSAFIL